MERFHERLVRDFVPQQTKFSNGETSSFRYGSQKDKREFLFSKINNEVAELRSNPNLQSLADINEAVLALAEIYNYSEKELMQSQLEQKTTKGKFDKVCIMNVEGADTHDSPGMSQVGVKALIFNKEKTHFLSVQKQDYYSGQWEIAGGRMKIGEDPEQALKREIDEELGFQVESKNLNCVITGYADPFRGFLPLFYNIFSVDVKNKKPVLSEEHQAYKWMDKKELEKRTKEESFNPSLGRMILKVWNED